MIGLSLQAHTKCAKCLGQVPLNALAEVYHCVSCGQAINVPATQWQKMLSGPLFAMAFDGGRAEASGSSSDGENGSTSQQDVHFAIRREAPAFPESNTTIDQAAALAAAPEGQIIAPDTGAPCSVREVPDPFREALSAVQLLVAESVDQLPGASDGAALAASSASSPITFQCPQCAGGLSVDGTSRTVQCRFCSSEAYLPDDLWQRLHPVPEVARWYVWLDPDQLSLHWRQLNSVYTDDEGNFGLRCTSPELDHDWVFVSLTPDLRVRWLTKKDQLASPSNSKLCPMPGERLLVWSDERDGVTLVSTRDGNKVLQIGGKTGKQPKDGEKFSVKKAEWVILDRDETLLTYRRREVKWGHELSRYDLEGNRLPCWQGEGKEGGWLERAFGADGPSFSKLKHRWFRCMERIKAKPGPDGSMFFLEEGKNWFNLGRYTRDGRQQYLVYHDHHANDICGDAEGNVYVLASDLARDSSIPHPDGTGWIHRNYLLRIGPDGTAPTVLVKSLIDGGPITFEDCVVVAKDGTVHAFGTEDRHLQFAPDGTLLKVSEGAKRAADELRKILEECDE